MSNYSSHRSGKKHQQNYSKKSNSTYNHNKRHDNEQNDDDSRDHPVRHYRSSSDSDKPIRQTPDSESQHAWRRGWMDDDSVGRREYTDYSEEIPVQSSRRYEDDRLPRKEGHRYDRSMYGRQVDRDDYDHIYGASREYASVRASREWQSPYDESEYVPIRARSQQRDSYYEDDYEQSDVSPRRRRFYTDFVEKAQTTFTKAVASVKTSQWWMKYPFLARMSKVKHIRLILAAVILFGVIGPSLLTAFEGYQQYTQLKTLGLNGMHELLAIKTTVSVATKSADPNSGIEGKGRAALQPAVLSQIKAESDAALADFQQLHTILAQRQGVLIVVGITPYNAMLESLTRLSQIGIDVAHIGQKFAAAGGNFAPIFQGKLLDPTGPPILTSTTFGTLMQFITSIQGDLDDTAQQFAGVNIAILPISASQKTQFQQIAPVIGPVVQGVDTMVQQKDALRWLLGVDAPRQFLIQTMDRGELRADGGFVGSFGVLTINGGRIGKISLTDIEKLDRDYPNIYGINSPYHNHPLPDSLLPAMPFIDNGLKEAGIYPDFPSAAKLAITMLHNEGGPQVDGVINFAPFVIEHLLANNVLGPMVVPCYNETVTSDNLELLIHEYQLGNDPVKLKLQAKCQGDASTSGRKQFTGAMSSELQDHLRNASPDQQGKAIASVLSDLHSKELEIYLTNADAEGWLVKGGNAGVQLTDPNIDTTQVVQTNIGGNKSGVYIATTLQEKITVASNGDAQHSLTLAISNNTHGNDVFGYCYNGVCSTDFRDFIRIYLPKSAQQVDGTGFEQTESSPICAYRGCVPSGSPTCQATSSNPRGVFQPDSIVQFSPYQGSGIQGYFSNGGPTYTGSNITNVPGYGLDGAGLAVYGGLSVIPDGCTATVTLQWVVPHIAANASASHPYTFIEQNQSDVFPNTTIQISGNGVQPMTKQINVMANNVTITEP